MLKIFVFIKGLLFFFFFTLNVFKNLVFKQNPTVCLIFECQRSQLLLLSILVFIQTACDLLEF